MSVSLLLVAILSPALISCAEAQASTPPKCDEDFITTVYKYWYKNGGVPQRVIERVSTMTNSCSQQSRYSRLLADSFPSPTHLTNILYYFFSHIF